MVSIEISTSLYNSLLSLCKKEKGKLVLELHFYSYLPVQVEANKFEDCVLVVDMAETECRMLTAGVYAQEKISQHSLPSRNPFNYYFSADVLLIAVRKKRRCMKKRQEAFTLPHHSWTSNENHKPSLHYLND